MRGPAAQDWLHIDTDVAQEQLVVGAQDGGQRHAGRRRPVGVADPSRIPGLQGGGQGQAQFVDGADGQERPCLLYTSRCV